MFPCHRSSLDLRQDRVCEQCQLVEVVEVEQLQVDGGRAEVGELTDSLDELVRCPTQPELPQLGWVAADRVGPV